MGVKENIRTLVEVSPNVKDNPTALAVLYWTFCDKIDIEPEIAAEIIKEGTPYESIARCLRKLKEEGVI